MRYNRLQLNSDKTKVLGVTAIRRCVNELYRNMFKEKGYFCAAGVVRRVLYNLILSIADVIQGALQVFWFTFTLPLAPRPLIVKLDMTQSLRNKGWHGKWNDMMKKESISRKEMMKKENINERKKKRR